MESDLQNIPQTKSARKKQRARERDAELKEMDREEWERRRKHKSDYGKLWRQQNPDKCSKYAEERKEKERIRKILEHNAKCTKIHENEVKSPEMSRWDRLFNC